MTATDHHAELLERHLPIVQVEMVERPLPRRCDRLATSRTTQPTLPNHGLPPPAQRFMLSVVPISTGSIATTLTLTLTSSATRTAARLRADDARRHDRPANDRAAGPEGHDGSTTGTTT
jgi:hypothetical protein